MKTHSFEIGDVVYEQTDSTKKRAMIITHWGKKIANPEAHQMDQYNDHDYDKVWCEWTTSRGKKERRQFPIVTLMKATNT